MTSTPVTKTQHSGFIDDYYYYDYENFTIEDVTTGPPCSEICIFYTVMNVIICVLGLFGNGLVIWIAGFKVKKSVISTWYLSLAVSDFLYCTFLPFSVVHFVKNSWDLGRFMCKFLFSGLYLNWFSSIFLLVIISVDRCVVVMFPVWARNQRTVRKASMIVILAWIISAGLCIPTFIFMDMESITLKRSLCSYTRDKQYFADVICRLFFLFVIPILIIIICYVLIIRKLKTNQMARSKKPFKIMMVLIVTFLICWLPYHIVTLMVITRRYGRYLYIISLFSDLFARTNSCLNPFLYAFMGKDFRMQCSALLSKIESAVVEEEDHNVVGQTVFTITVENNLSKTA